MACFFLEVITYFILSNFCYGFEDINIKQINSSGKNIINFLNPIKFGRLSLPFISQPEYVKSLAIHPILPDPTFDEWLQASDDNTINYENNKIAYVGFLKGKRILESSNDLYIYPSLPSDENGEKDINSEENKKKCNSDVCPNYPQFLDSLDALQNSIQTSPNKWTQFFRGIVLTRIRAFKLASTDFVAAQQFFKKNNYLKEEVLANSFYEAISKWQSNKDYLVKGPFSSFTCPKTPEKIKESIGGDMGVCTLVFCGAWLGSENKIIRQQTILNTLDIALSKLLSKSKKQIQNDPIYSCAIAVNDDDDTIQLDISNKLLSFMKKVKIYNKFDEHFFKVEDFYLKSGNENQALMLLKDNISVLSNSYNPLELALKYTFDLKINSREALEHRLNILSLSEHDSAILLQLKVAGLLQNAAIKTIASKLLKRFQEDLTKNELLPANCIVNELLVCKINVIVNKILSSDFEELKQEIYRIFRSFMYFITHEGITEQEANSFRQYQAAIEKLIEIQNIPNDLRIVISEWINKKSDLKNSLKIYITEVAKLLNLATDQNQRFKESAFSLATQMLFTILMELDPTASDYHPFVTLLSKISFNVNGDKTKIEETKRILSKQIPSMVNSFIENKLQKKASPLFDGVLKCIINQNTTLDCQKIYVNSFYALYASYIDTIKKDFPEIANVFLNMGAQANSQALTSLVKGVKFWDSMLNSTISILPKIEEAAESESLNDDEKRILWTLAMIFDISKYKAQSVILATKIQNNIKLPTTMVGEIAFVTSSINLCYLKQELNFEPNQVTKIQSPLMVGLLIATPCLVAKMPINELNNSFDYFNTLNFGNRKIVGFFALIALAWDNLDFEHTKALINEAKYYDGEDIKYFIPSSNNLKFTIPYILPELMKSFSVGDNESSRKCEFVKFGVEHPKSLYIKFYGSICNIDVKNTLSVAFIRSAARSREWAILKSEFINSNTNIFKSEIDAIYWRANFAGAILTSEHPPKYLKKIALELAHKYRSDPSLGNANGILSSSNLKKLRLELLNGLIYKPFILRKIILNGKIENYDKLVSVLEGYIGVKINDNVIIRLTKRIFDEHLIKDAFVSIEDDIITINIK